ncbi:MAG: xylose isomerase [Candidatus Hydrogenedentota bacterium]
MLELLGSYAMPEPMTDIKRLCLHTMTTKPWSLKEAVAGYAVAGVPGITVWRQHVDPLGDAEAARVLAGSGLKVVSLCRGGFFPKWDPEEQFEAIDDNLRVIDTAAAIGAPLVVLVCGAWPKLPLEESRRQIRFGIERILPHAAECGVKLGIEPLHPMYAGDRSAVNTLKQANDMVAAIGHPNVGVTVDVYHLWWDPDLQAEIRRAGKSIFSFHVCDWRHPTRDMLNDRGMMGEGCIPIPQIRGWVEETGFDGPIEVEIFSDEFWAGDQADLVERIKGAYLTAV